MLGRDWLAHIHLDWFYLAYQSQSTSKLEELLQKYEEVFHEELGTVKSMKVTLTIRKNNLPKFTRPRTVPFAIKDAIAKEIDRLEATGACGLCPM